jgi:hypothetical protein
LARPYTRFIDLNLSNGERKAYIMEYTPADARHGQTGQPFNNPVVVRGGQPVVA